MNPQRIAHQIEKLKKRLAELGPLHPGSISEQYNVCGTPGCQCKDPKKPRRHGPYYQLSFYLAGQEQHAIRAAEGLARDAPEGGQLQAAAGNWSTSGWSWRSNWRKARAGGGEQGHGD